MDIQRTPLHGPHRETQNKAEQQREYRERERLAFRNLLAALKEVGPTNPRSRCDILRKAAECLRRLGEEQVNLQQQLRVNVAGTDVPQTEAQDVFLLDEDLELLQFYLAAQSEYPGDQGATSGYTSWYGGGASTRRRLRVPEISP
ncbi:hypothetical protein M405DRAFT_882249, partial [Rhizopogon salebrosus TDB-379]